MKRRGLSLDFMRGLLLPLSAAYGGVIRTRNRHYDRAPSAVHSAGVPVISVGNLTVGGTGKTPLTIEIVNRLQAVGRRPAVLTRGYGATKDQPADEVREFQLALPDTPLVVNPDRLAGAAIARQEYGADCLVLDDGFQHRRLRRDLDIVLIDALDPWGGQRLLPAGRLREPLTSLKRADWFVLNRTNQVEPETVQEISATLRHYAPRTPVTKAAMAPLQLVGTNGHTKVPRMLSEKRVLPVCGVGNPEGFLHLIKRLAGQACQPLLFADHHRYRPRDIKTIMAATQRYQAEWVVTTRKDWVKLNEVWPPQSQAGGTVELFRLDGCLVLADPQGLFEARLQSLFEEHK